MKGGSIDDAQSIDSDNPIIRIHDAPNSAASMIVPNSHDSIPTELLQRSRDVGVVREEVDGGVGAHVEEDREREVVVLEGGEGLRLDHTLDNFEAADASLEILRVLEVVESD